MPREMYLNTCSRISCENSNDISMHWRRRESGEWKLCRKQYHMPFPRIAVPDLEIMSGSMQPR